MANAILDTDHWKANDVLARTGLPSLLHQIAYAIAEERERCARVAEHLNGWGKKPNPELAQHIAKVIRAG